MAVAAVVAAQATVGEENEENMEQRFSELVRRLQEVHNDNLVSVILYGSAIVTAGPARSADCHLLIIVNTLSIHDLRRARPVMEWWRSAGFPYAPHFTKSEFLSSLDVFPIESKQIQRAYRVLWGSDLLAGVEISPAHLRLLTEYELRGKLLRLRALYLLASDDPRRLFELMTESVVSFVQFSRPILELLGEDPPVERLSTVRRLGERLGIEITSLERILKLRDEPIELLEIEIQDIFASYLNCLEQVIESVDRIK